MATLKIETFGAEEDAVATALLAVAVRPREDYAFRCKFGYDPLAEVVSVEGNTVTVRVTRAA